MRQLVLTLHPPAELVASPEFQALLDLLRPRAGSAERSGLAEAPVLRGKTRLDVLNRQVQEAVDSASQRAAARRVEAAQRAGGECAALTAHALLAMARALQQRRKKQSRRTA